MTGNAFFEFPKIVFQPCLETIKVALPVLLFVDGNATLMSTNFCEKHQIILTYLFPNSTHLTQPLDVSFFRPLKKKKRWENSLLDFRCKNGIRAITKSEICPLLKTALDNFDSMEIACSLLTYLLKLISKEWFVLMVSRNCKLCFNVGKPIDSR